jgi:hypothetical protein
VSHPDPAGAPDTRPLVAGEVWENPVTLERAVLLEAPWWNDGQQDAIARVEITPSERFVHLIETLFGLAREGHVNKRGMPHPLQLALALITTEFADVIVFRRPPAAVQRVLFGALAPIARRRGYRATYPSLSRTTWAPRQPSAPNLEAEP